MLLADTVTASGYSIADDTGLASNYALTSTSATAAANITPRDVTIAGTVANDKLYDGNTLATLFNIGAVTTGVGIGDADPQRPACRQHQLQRSERAAGQTR